MLCFLPLGTLHAPASTSHATAGRLFLLASLPWHTACYLLVHQPSRPYVLLTK